MDEPKRLMPEVFLGIIGICGGMYFTAILKSAMHQDGDVPIYYILAALPVIWSVVILLGQHGKWEDFEDADNG